MDIPTVLRKLQLRLSSPVLDKAKEYYRRLSQNNGTAQERACRAAICLELATQSQNVAFPRGEATKLCGLKEKDYVRMLGSARTRLNISTNISMSSLCARHGVEGLQETCDEAFRKFANIYKKQEPNAGLDHPKFSCAVFYVCCKANKFSVAKSKLIECADTGAKELDELIKIVQESLPGLVAVKPTTAKKRKSTASSAIDTNDPNDDSRPPSDTEDEQPQPQSGRPRRTRTTLSSPSTPSSTGNHDSTTKKRRIDTDKCATQPTASRGTRLLQAETTAAQTRTPSSTVKPKTPGTTVKPKTPGSVSLARRLFTADQRNTTAQHSTTSTTLNSKYLQHKTDADRDYSHLEYPEWKQKILDTARAIVASSS